ncbi:MAG: SRPBCC family protein [Acidimicrobiales bacterium]
MKEARQMSQLSVEAEGTTRAGPEVVWSLVANANTFPKWGPWNDGGYRPPSAGPSQEGSVQWFRYGRRTTSVEQILEIDELRRLAYTVVSGIPVKNYRAEVTLTPTSTGGTSIRWAASWDKTLMGSLVRRKLLQVYPEIVAALVVAADQQVASSARH